MYQSYEYHVVYVVGNLLMVMVYSLIELIKLGPLYGLKKCKTYT